MTFSIAAKCSVTGQLGVAVTSSSIAVASRCAFVRAGTGAALSQNITDPRLGPRMLDLLDDGMSVEEALQGAAASTSHSSHRQLALIDNNGEAACFSGELTLGIHAATIGQHCVSVGNLLSGTDVTQAITTKFVHSSGQLAERLIAALSAGLEAGGEAGNIRSAGLMIADDVSWPITDLRVDWHDWPLAELGNLWELYEPQLADYRTRALNPVEAPSYGVPGDP